MKRAPIVWVEGSIAAGKSTLVTQLARLLQLKAYAEPIIDEPLLKAFYADPKRYAFSFQVEALRRRWVLQRTVALECQAGGIRGALVDRGLPGDRVFAQLHHEAGNISDLEWQTYEALYSEFMSVPHQQPTVLVYLQVSPETAMRRLLKRSRAAEVGVTLSYLEQVDAGYRRLLIDLEEGRLDWSHRLRVVRVDWEQDDQDVKSIASLVETRLA